MYYLLAAVLIFIVYIVFVKIVSSLIKGCLVTGGVFVLVVIGFLLLKSTKTPVILFDTFVVEDFKVTKIKTLPFECVYFRESSICSE